MNFSDNSRISIMSVDTYIYKTQTQRKQHRLKLKWFCSLSLLNVVRVYVMLISFVVVFCFVHNFFWFRSLSLLNLVRVYVMLISFVVVFLFCS